MIPFVLSASTSVAAPKVQVVTYLVCKTLRPEYTDRSGAGRPSTFFFAPEADETKLCNADPVVQAASAEFLTCRCLKRYPVRAPEDNTFGK